MIDEEFITTINRGQHPGHGPQDRAVLLWEISLWNPGHASGPGLPGTEYFPGHSPGLMQTIDY